MHPVAEHRALVLEHAIRRGSSWPIVVTTGGGRFVVKLRGAGQGTAALVAEWIVAGIADLIGLRVPRRALIQIDAALVREDRDQELADLIAASHGENLGFDWLEGARELDPAALSRVDEDLASRIAWLDALVENVDRTPKNPNLLGYGGEIWLIDHGAALPFSYDWASVTEDAPHESLKLDHALRSRATLLAEVDAELAARLTRAALDELADSIPASFLDAADADALLRARRAYATYLYKRLKPPRRFLKAIS
jgi:hypothetical protein